MTEAPKEFTDEPEDDSIDLLELFVRFVQLWRTGAVTFLISSLIGAALVFHIKALYEADVSLLPSQSPAESNSLSAVFSGRRPGETYVGLLRSRAVEDNVIRRLELGKLYGTTSQDAARASLGAATKISVGADSIIKVQVRDRNAEAAARIADAYLDALQDQHQAMALLQSVHNRELYSRQLEQEKEALASAEEDLKRTEESSGVVQDQTQTQLGLAALDDIRRQITTLRVQLSALLLGSTEQNPQIQAIRSQISQLQAQESSLETGNSRRGSGVIPLGRMPQVNLEYQRKQREVKFHEILLNTLSNQLQNAKWSEVASSTSFEIVDRAAIPEFRAWPPRLLLLELVAIASIFLASMAIVLQMFGRRMLADPLNQAHFHELRKQFSVKG